MGTGTAPTGWATDWTACRHLNHLLDAGVPAKDLSLLFPPGDARDCMARSHAVNACYHYRNTYTLRHYRENPKGGAEALAALWDLADSLMVNAIVEKYPQGV